MAYLHLISLTTKLIYYSPKIKAAIPIDPIGTISGEEFSQTKKIISNLLYLPESDSKLFSEQIQNTINNVSRISTYHPSLLDFMVLIAVWKFLSELKDMAKPTFKQLWDHQEKVGKLKCFSKIWEKCLTGQFDISHELSYFYFQDPFYKNEDLSMCPKHFIDNMCLLGRFIYSSSDNEIHFSPSILEHVRQEELSITNNGSAHILDGASLIVTVTEQNYRLQGMNLSEKEFWDWMFRLLSCLRECFILAGICSTDLRELSKDDIGSLKKIFWFASLIILLPATICIFLTRKYFQEISVFYLIVLIMLLTLGILVTSIYRYWKNFKLKKNVSQLSNLLFTIEESINSITSSKMPVVQVKLKIFSERMGLDSLIENLNHRRINLETKISQNITEWIGIVSILIAFIALIIAILTLAHDINNDKNKVGDGSVTSESK